MCVALDFTVSVVSFTLYRTKLLHLVLLNCTLSTDKTPIQLNTPNCMGMFSQQSVFFLQFEFHSQTALFYIIVKVLPIPPNDGQILKLT